MCFTVFRLVKSENLEKSVSNTEKNYFFSNFVTQINLYLLFIKKKKQVWTITQKKNGTIQLKWQTFL